MTPTLVKAGDYVRFEKNGRPISGTLKYAEVDHIDEEGIVWLRLDIKTESHIVKEDEVEIVQYGKPVRHAG